MTKDRYALELERAIFNWYYGGDNAAPEAVFNAVANGLNNDMQIIVPIELPEAMLQTIGDPEKAKIGETFSVSEDIPIKFRHLAADEDGHYFIPLFTSHEELEKGESSSSINQSLNVLFEAVDNWTDCVGYIINPWGQSFMLAKELIEMIFEADGGVEYSVPDDSITAELLEDGSFLKRAVEICNRNRTQLNLIKLARILRDSWVWVPCTAVFSDTDKEAMDKVVMEAIEKDDPDSLIGQELTSHDEVRFVPDILQNGEELFFPVFTTAEEMGEYGDGFSKYQAHFLHAANLAKNNEKKVSGIVINAFSEPFVVPKEMFDIIADMNSSVEVQDGD